ncbi:MAG: hypothetical protein H6839_16370 [Planctomycetes bacterium]|nr:hypothetical protein [Planctomycetota bacterium]
MSDDPEIKCKASCSCGWTEVFSRAYSGLMIECPQCGKNHRIPTFDAPDADSAIDMSTMHQLLEQDPPAGPRPGVQFRPLLIFSCVVAAVVAALGLLLLRNHFPANVAVAGGALSWPLGVSVAWLGQVRHRKKLSRSETSFH